MASIGSVINTVDPSSAASTTASSSSSSSTSSSTDALANESTFLQLLVSEIKNQDPTAPMDSTTFLTQLAQFSQLEQMSGIRQDIETGTYDAPTGTASTANATTPTTATTNDALANLTAAATPASLATNAATTVDPTTGL